MNRFAERFSTITALMAYGIMLGMAFGVI